MRITWLVLLVASCASQPDDAKHVVLTRVGGFAPTPGAGSTCQPMDEIYDLDLLQHRLAWQICASDTIGGVYTMRPGSVALDATQSDTLATDVDAIRPAQGCGGGDISDTLMVDSATYHDAQCMSGENALYTDLSDVMYAR